MSGYGYGDGLRVVTPEPTGRYWDRRRQREYWADYAAYLAGIWHAVIVGLGLHQTRPGVTGSVELVPHATSFDLRGENPSWLVKLLPGQSAEDLAVHVDAIAREFEVPVVRITGRPNRMARVEILTADPMAADVWVEDSQATSARGAILLGHDEAGEPLTRSLLDLRHTIVQGSSGSGKSFFSYALLSQVVEAGDVLIAGSDPSGVLLRPFGGTAHGQWQAIGNDLDRHLAVLAALESELDRRLPLIPPREDSIEPSEGMPAILCVLEEYAGLIRLAMGLGGKEGKQAADEIRRIVARLASEARKVAMYLLVLIQRADASLIGGFERSQFTSRISFRVDNADAVGMLHPGGRGAAEAHCAALPGVALISLPGLRLSRMKAARLASYSDYVDRVRAVQAESGSRITGR